MDKIESGSYLDGKLDIDGGIGDYKMSVFRLKDRNKRLKQIPTIFTHTFMKRVEQSSPETYS